MRKVLLIHIISIRCCNPLVTMLNNGNFGFPYSLLPRFPPLQSGAAFSTPAISTPTFRYSRVFHSHVFSRPVEPAEKCRTID